MLQLYSINAWHKKKRGFHKYKFSFGIKKSRYPKIINKIVTYKSYDKLQATLGNVGGFWSFLMLLGYLLVSPVNKLDLRLKMLNEFFSFEIE